MVIRILYSVYQIITSLTIISPHFQGVGANLQFKCA